MGSTPGSTAAGSGSGFGARSTSSALGTNRTAGTGTGSGGGSMPQDLASRLSSLLPEEDADRWRTIIEADLRIQAAAPRQPEFSDAYLAAMPSRAASSLLQGLLGGDE